METIENALHFVISAAVTRHADWEWGLLLVFLTVVLHVSGLGLMNNGAVHVFSRLKGRRHSTTAFVVVLGAITLLATILHVVEIIIWAGSYRFLGALPDSQSAMLYSLNAITSYGHESLFLEPRWRLLGATEALNGWLLFGLTTAFLFSMFQQVLQLMDHRE
jgi:hypothetical protein